MNILSNYDKVLYIDSDTIIQGDLTELFNTNLKDTYAAVVKDTAAILTLNWHKKLNLKNYFNAGVLLLNLKKLREDNIHEKFVESINEREDLALSLDQHTQNICYRDNVTFLSPKYNYMITNSKFSLKKLALFFDIDIGEMKNIIKFPIIIHYSGWLKPYNYFVPYRKVWHKYFDISPCKSTPIRYKFIAELRKTLPHCILRKIKQTILSFLKIKKSEN